MSDKDKRIRKNIYFDPVVLNQLETLRKQTDTDISFNLWMHLVVKRFIYDELQFRRYTHAPDKR